MKTTHFVSRFPALSETFILDQITGLLDRNQEVEIVSLWSGIDQDENVSHSVISKYNLMDRLDRVGYPFNRLFRVIQLIALVLKLFIVSPIRSFRCFSLLRDVPMDQWLQAWFAGDYFRRRDCEIVHAHFGWNGLVLAIIKHVGWLDAPVVTTLYGSDVTVFPDRFDYDYELLFQETELILAECEHFKHRLQSLGCPEDKLEIHRIGINVNNFDYQPSEYDNSSTLKLLSVGRLINCKGFEYAIRSLKGLNLPSDIHYRIVGDGLNRSKLDDLIEELSLQDSITLEGRKPRQDVKQFMRESNLLIAPSITDEKGRQDSTMMVLVEAMALGLPVLASDLPGTREMIEDGQSGLLAREKDPGSISKKIWTFVQEMNHQERQTMVKKAREVIEAKFNIDVWNDRLVDRYRQLIK